MSNIRWDFPLLGTASLSGSNNAAITMFKGTGIMDGLAREICQNSLDAKRKDLPDEVPVKMKFELVYLEKSKYPLFSEYENMVDNAISFWNNHPLRTPDIESFLANIKSALTEEFIPVLVMSDYNTSGLTGVNPKPGEQSVWKLLVDTEGISIKQNDISAGSFGIGKNAPFAYSAYNMVCYNTLAEDGGRAFEGVTHIVTSQRHINGKNLPTQSTGKYLYFENEYTWRPVFPEDNCDVAQLDIFKRKEPGTDVAIFGFKTDEYPNWEKTTVVAILKNFVLAVLQGKLEVTVKSDDVTYVVDKNNLESLLFDEFSEDVQLRYTRQIYETVTKSKPQNRKIEESNDLSIYVRYDDSYRASLSRFRSTGMLINTTSESLPHYSIVVIVNDVGEKKLSKTLRKAEPPQHTEWKAKNITDDKKLHNLAAKYIRNISKAIQNILDEFERAEITDKVDAGIGSYLPDSSDMSVSSEGTDGLRTDIKIKEISSYDGRVFYNNQYESAESQNGTAVKGSGIKAGKRKHKKRQNKKIKVVKQSSGDKKGVSSGSGKVKIVSLNITEHRTYLMAGNKYRLYLNSPQEYSNVYIRYYAGREDNGKDALVIKNVKLENLPLKDVNSEIMGPISLREGDNYIYVEFANEEIMAVIPEFTMEVSNEKSNS